MSAKTKARLASMTPIKREAVKRAFEVTSFSIKELDLWYDCFASVADEEGNLGESEMKRMFSSKGIGEKEMKTFCHAWGILDDKRIDFLTFVKQWCRALKSDRYGFMFDSFDLDDSQNIGYEELVEIMRIAKMPEDKIQQNAKKLYDALSNQHGYITRDAFVDIFEHNMWADEDESDSNVKSSTKGFARPRRPSLESLGFSVDASLFMEIGRSLMKEGRKLRRRRKEQAARDAEAARGENVELD